MRVQSGQALVEWALSAFVLLLLSLGILAVGQVVGEDMAIRSAASQAAFAAARAPSAQAAQTAGLAAGQEAVRGAQIEDFQLTIDTGSFQRLGSNREQQVKVRIVKATLSHVVRPNTKPAND